MSRPVDPRFAQIAKALYGDVFDTRELWELAKANDPSEVHNDGDPQKKKHSKTAGLLVLGAAAEGVGTYRAGEAALKAVRSGGAAAGKAAKVGEAGLQAANLGVGLVAAHELAKKPKPIPPNSTVSKGKHSAKGGFKPTFQFRPKVTQMTDAEKKTWQAARTASSTKGVRILAGATAAGGLALGHHLGVRRGRINASRELGTQPPAQPVEEPQQVAKAAFRVKPINANDQRRVVSLKARKPPMAPPLAKGYFTKPKHAAGSPRPHEPQHVKPPYVAQHRRLKATPITAAAAPTAEAAPVEAAAKAVKAGRSLRTPLAIGGAAAVGGLAATALHRDSSVNKRSRELSWVGTISKVDTEKRQVFGWCSLSKIDGKDVVDLQGDYVPLDEIEKSAYKYVIESRKGGDMHRRVSKFAGDAPLHTADLIESFVVTPDKLKGMGLAEDALPHGWWVGFKVNDEEQWVKVKNGERAGFSIHGTGQRRPVAA